MDDQKINDEIDKKITKTILISAPGTMFIGFAIYAIFEAKGNAFHPLLNNMVVVYGMLAIGVITFIWQIKQIFILNKMRPEK